MRRVPLLATLLVLAAVAVMLRLGLWQLDRLHEKQHLLASYAAAQADATIHPWSGKGGAPQAYSRVSLSCMKVASVAAQAGQSAQHQAGWVQVAVCLTPGGAQPQVVLGWSTQSAPVAWSGGLVTGIYLAKGTPGGVVIADPPLANLAANARPDPADVPNNHLAYAVQWFLFAATALIIYGLALRKRLAAAAQHG